MKWDRFTAEDPEDCVWDVVVVGTGAGGGAAGFNLARMGQKVLFLERGVWETDAEGPGDRGSDWWPEKVCRVGRQTGGTLGEGPNIGCGVGGSTAVASLTMDRFRPIDFTPRSVAPPSAAALVPEVWPITYEELEPYYREAEALFRLRGTEDPLTPVNFSLLEPLEYSPEERKIHDWLRACSLHPYRIHTASERIPGCTFCRRKRCERNCRNDSRKICVVPALEQHGAKILTGCHVKKIGSRGRVVTNVICRWRDRDIVVRARKFVLALHAMLTPALLLRSANADFPQGLANSSGLVGRNLMLHATDILAVKFADLPSSEHEYLGHGVSLNDFYVKDSVKLGNVHLHPFGILREQESLRFVFATIMEDFPYPENRILQSSVDPSGVQWEYDYPSELRQRCEVMVSYFGDALRSVGTVEHLNPPPRGNLNMGHACGTCRFGDDPRTSVLDRNNRAHDLDNLYVLDASFFPSSGGMNPSLTIVANSLRASTCMVRE